MVLTKYQKFYRNNSKKRRIQTREYNKRIRTATLDLLGGKCFRCGFSDIRALQIDHVNGGGTKEKKAITTNFMKFILDKILQGSTEYQILCANCNWIKRDENNEIGKELF